MSPAPRRSVAAEAERRIAAEFRAVGCDGWCHAQVIGRPGLELGYRPDAPVVIASMYKLCLLVAVCRAAGEGHVDLASRILVEPDAHEPGPTGFSLFEDPVDVSLRDLVRSMIVVSDNAAAELIHSLLPAGLPARVITDLGLSHTRLFPAAVGERPGEGQAQAAGDRHDADGATESADAARLLAEFAHDDERTRQSPAYYSQSTPRELCDLLEAIWTDRAADPVHCAWMRRVLGEQVWRHRIVSGFPARHFRFAGKTGTIDRVRAESSVVTPLGEQPIAVSVITRAARAEPELPDVDRAIGRVARIAVDALRRAADV